MTDTARMHLKEMEYFAEEIKKSSSKKKRSSSGGGGQGFGGGGGSAATVIDRFPYAGTIRPGKQSPQRIVVDSSIVLPDYADDGIPKKGRNSPLLPWIIEVKTDQEITKMRAAGKLAREVLDMAGQAVDVGVTTDEIDTLVHEATIKVCFVCVLCCVCYLLMFVLPKGAYVYLDKLDSFHFCDV